MLPDAVEQLERQLIEEGTAKFRWQQTKSGSDTRPEPPGIDQEAEAALYSSVNYR